MIPSIRIALRAAAPLITATTVLAQPIVTTEPRTQFQWENKPVSLTVVATGNAPLSYQWQFNGADILGATNRFFTMASVRLTNDGSFRVIVSNTAGTRTSQVARVMVRAWPDPTGPFIPELARLDMSMMNLMLSNSVPGGSLAVVKDGRLVLARGYGFAEVGSSQRYYPDSLCRAASLSKTITAAAAMKLVEKGKLHLDTPVYPELSIYLRNYPGAQFDPRWTNVTVRRLLNHSGGWNRLIARDPLGVIGFDPVSWPNQIRTDLNLLEHPDSRDLVTWMLGKPMQFTPGTRFEYSNFGYSVVELLMNRLSDEGGYESTAKSILAEAGITRMQMALDTRSGRRAGEVVYYLHPSITPEWAREWVEPRPFNFDLPYAWPMSLAFAPAGWLVSAIDFARFIAAIDGTSSYPDVLSAESVATMVARPTAAATTADGFFGLGWDSVSPSSGVWYKAGSDVGWRSGALKYKNGVIAVFTLNTYWEATRSSQIISMLGSAIDTVREWPEHDLFPATLSYEAWRAKFFSPAELVHAAISNDNADPDADGLPNLIEYASGSDPRVASPQPRLDASLSHQNGQRSLRVAFRRLLLAHEINYTLEASADLINWASAGDRMYDVGLNPDGTVTSAISVAPQNNRFFRLQFSRKPQ
jgi:CubicO group peptidase (beta-lactamase class C family)